MDSEKLVDELKDAGAEFVQKMESSFPLSVAVWGRSDETGRWNLYIASDQITDQNFDIAYGEVLRVASEMNSPMFDPFEVKIIFMDDPLAKFVTDLHQRHPVKLATWFRIGSLTGLSVDKGYIYPHQSSTVAKGA
jgi:hypothetical protein